MIKNILFSFIIVFLCFLLIGCDNNSSSSNGLISNGNSSISNISRYVIIEDDNGEKYRIYYYGIEDAMITIGKDNYDFEQAILSDTLTLDDILNEMELAYSLYDGGTTIYRDSGSRKYFNDSYSIIKCNTIDGNKDIYIGNNDMEYEDGFCKFITTEAEIKLQKEVEKLNKTKKIIVRNRVDNKIIHTIDNEEDISNLNKIISRGTENTLPTIAIGSNLNVQYFDDEDRMITSMNIWDIGYFDFYNSRQYYISKSDLASFKKILKID